MRKRNTYLLSSFSVFMANAEQSFQWTPYRNRLSYVRFAYFFDNILMRETKIVIQSLPIK